MASSSDEQIEMATRESTVHVRVPKRVLHFSDGTLEEFSSSDEEPTETDSRVVPKPEGWGPWMLWKLKETGETTLAACDYVGEALASFLGITSPKYQYELEEYQRMIKEKLEYEAKAEGWSSASTMVTQNEITTEQPQQNPKPTPV